MYQVFNMGHRMELYTDESTAQSIIQISKSFDINAQIIGRVEAAQQASVELKSEKGHFQYP
jgi:phosphoribosylformylglycinamidine cyclo-ligase